MCYLLPNRPGASRLESIYLSRLGVMAVAVGVVLAVNHWLLVPRLMHRRPVILYFLSLFAVVIGAAGGVYEANGWVQELITGRPPRYPSSHARMVLVFFNQIMVFAGLGSIFEYIRFRGRTQAIERQKLEAELTALKAQLNPHFLFNSLNNIYSLALDKSDLAPDYVLKLSELMRYILHDSQAPLVPLRKELEFVQNYLDLEGIRTEGAVRMSLDVEGEVDGVSVAPLVLLPFVENAFKHGVNMSPEQAFVEITVKVTPAGELEIEAVNSKERAEPMPLLHPDGSELPGGVGLENVRRRLELLYPARHELQLSDGGNRFEVNLRITA